MATNKQYDDNMSGAAFKNDNSERGDTFPAYSGSVEILKLPYYVDIWVNITKEGKKYLKLRFKAKQPTTADIDD